MLPLEQTIHLENDDSWTNPPWASPLGRTREKCSNRSNRTNRLKSSKPGHFRRRRMWGMLNPSWTGDLNARVFIYGWSRATETETETKGRTAWKLRAVFGSLVSLSFPSVFIGKMDPKTAFVSSFPRVETGNRKQTRAEETKMETEAKSPL